MKTEVSFNKKNKIIAAAIIFYRKTGGCIVQDTWKKSFRHKNNRSRLLFFVETGLRSMILVNHEFNRIPLINCLNSITSEQK